MVDPWGNDVMGDGWEVSTHMLRYEQEERGDVWTSPSY